MIFLNHFFINTYLQVPLELSSHGLHVDLEPQLGVLSELQVVLDLLVLRLQLRELRLERALGLLQLVDVLVGRALSVSQLIQLGLQETLRTF